MKTIATILAAFASTLVLAQEPSTATPLPATNVVPAPLIMKGLYGTRSRTSTNPPPRTMENAVMNALRMFKSTQNEDGSWGEEEHRRLATPLVMGVFLAHGETENSLEFGDAIARAHRYVMACHPTNDAERIGAINCLTEYVAIHVGNARRDLAQTEVAKIQDLLSSVQDTAGHAWIDYLTFHRLPPEIPRPDWLKYTREFPRRWLDVQVNVAPETLDEYLALRLAGLAKFWIGGKAWGDFHRQFGPKMIERQTPEGFYPCHPAADRFVCAALAVQSMEVYYARPPQYYAIPEPEQETEDEEIRIEF